MDSTQATQHMNSFLFTLQQNILDIFFSFAFFFAQAFQTFPLHLHWMIFTIAIRIEWNRFVESVCCGRTVARWLKEI